MSFVPQAIAAIVLVTLTVSLQGAGMALLIHWARFQFASGIQQLTPLNGTVLIIRFTSMIIGLHMVQIMLWTLFYRWLCFPSLESSFYFSTTSYSTVGYGDVVLPHSVAYSGSLRKRGRRTHVRIVRESPVRRRDSARGPIRDTVRRRVHEATPIALPAPSL